MRRKLTSVMAAIAIAIGAIAWILSGQYGKANDAADDGAAAETRSAADGSAERVAETRTAETRAGAAMTAVRYRTSFAEPREISLIVTGRTEASRRVIVRAETEGSVAAILAERGARIAPGDAIARLDIDDREARLAEAEAVLRQRRIEFDAAKSLNTRGFRADTALAGAQAALDAARATVKRIRIDIDNTRIAAPFEGVLQARPIEVGDYLREGDQVATIVDLDPIVIAVDVAERQIGAVEMGQVGRATLVNGERLDVVVRYISASANPATRTFLVELESPNPDHRVAEGLTAELSLPLETRLAHSVAPGLLSLDDDGVIGLKTVDAVGRVVFHPVDIIDGDESRVWVAGLPDRVDLITVGQEFVRAGQKVDAVPDSDAGS